MSYSNSFPTQRPSLNLVFNGGSDQLDSRISYSRSSTATAFSSERHLSSENLITQSDASNWTVASAVYTKTANQSGPDGSTNARKFTEKSNGSDQYKVQSNSFTPIANEEITYSVWLKQTSGNRDYQQIRVGNIGANKAFATFNLTNGTVDQTGGTLGVSASVNAGPTGWYQCIMRFTPTSTAALSFYIYAAAASGGEIPNVIGDTGNSYMLFGAQASTTGETVVNETSGQIHRSFAPTLKTSAADAPRFEFASDGQSVAKGLLIEAQKTNLALNSNDFTNATWNKQRVTVTPSAAVGPDGQLSASLIAENTDTTTLHFMLPTAAITSGYSVGTDKSTHSVFAKYAGRNLRMADGYNSADGGSTIFDLQNGAVVSGGGSIQNCGNGWYRCSITMTMSASALLLPYIQLVDGTSWPNASDAGDGYSGVLLFGLQTEQQSMSSYITTGGSTVSRASDSCSVALNGFGVDVSMATEFSCDYVDTQFRRVAELSLESGSGLHTTHQVYNGTAYSYATNTSGSNRTLKSVTSIAGASQNMVSTQIGSTAFAAANGVAGASESNISNDMIYGKLHIGEDYNGGRQLNGHIRRVALYNTGLADAKVTALSN